LLVIITLPALQKIGYNVYVTCWSFIFTTWRSGDYFLFLYY